MLLLLVASAGIWFVARQSTIYLTVAVDVELASGVALPVEVPVVPPQRSVLRSGNAENRCNGLPPISAPE
ncbi:hypothetical protein PMIT1327_02486 [Prochlorococcus marinus str. MIT 1327]|nr:hypothetical protein PMIT1312_01433 [Prochlorococcus marinus str. MIT 1312]KZR79279.1 hypothetical protein PMIT1327_02486 [Prochlorococcus marinus str. MIT 1327]